MKVRKSEVNEILKATFPNYKGRKFHVDFSEKIWVDRIGGGGSFEKVCIAFHDGKKWVSKNPEVSKLEAPCGYLTIHPMFIYAVHSIFCGSDMGIRFYVHPSSNYKPIMIGQEV